MNSKLLSSSQLFALSFIAVLTLGASVAAMPAQAAGVASTTSVGSSTISGTVFNDTNRNKVQDNGEGGIAGVLVWLHLGKHKYNSPVVATTTTDSFGHYVFSNLANGTYFVEQQLINGFKQKSSDKKVKLTAIKSSATINFADVSASSTKKHGDTDKESNDDNGNHKGEGKDN